MNVLIAPFRAGVHYPVNLDLCGMFREFGARRPEFSRKFGVADLRRRGGLQRCRRSAWQVRDKA